MMKKIIINVLVSTALTLLCIACVATVYGAKFICVSAVFQSLLANSIIHFGLLLIDKVESPYFVVEMGLQYGYITVVILTSAHIFDWFSSTPFWTLILMITLVYMGMCVIGILRINSDIDSINEQIKIRKQKTGK